VCIHCKAALATIITAMWPFKKNASVPNKLPIDGPWSVSESKHNAQDLIIRINTGYREYKSLSGYEHQIGIAVPLIKPETTGLPSTTENEQLGEIEDQICESLEKEAMSLLVAVITTSGMREFVFYTRNPRQVEDSVVELRKRIASHQLQLMIQPDKAWGVYGGLG
jgi:hypothetical protein